MSPAQALIEKLAADVAAASTSPKTPVVPVPQPSSVAGKVIQWQCENGHNVTWRGGQVGYKHVNHEDCSSRTYRSVTRSQVSAAAREAYRAMRKSQKEAKK